MSGSPIAKFSQTMVGRRYLGPSNWTRSPWKNDRWFVGVLEGAISFKVCFVFWTVAFHFKA